MFFAQVLRNVFGARNHANEIETGFGKSGDIIGEIFGVFTITDNNGALGGATIFQSMSTNSADGAAEETEADKTSKDDINRHDANWEKVNMEEEVVGDDSHDTDDGGEQEAAEFGPATATQKNGLLVKSKRGHDNNIDWEQPNHREGKLERFSLEIEGALVEMSAGEIGHQKGEENRDSVSEDEKNVEN